MTRVKQQKGKKYKRSRLDQDLRNYRLHCRDVHAAVNIARSEYGRNTFSNKSCRPKEFFNYIDKRTNSTIAIPSLQVGSAVVVADSQKAEEQSRYFGRVFTIDNGIMPRFFIKMPPFFPNIGIICFSSLWCALRPSGERSPGLCSWRAKPWVPSLLGSWRIDTGE